MHETVAICNGCRVTEKTLSIAVIGGKRITCSFFKGADFELDGCTVEDFYHWIVEPLVNWML